MTKSPKRKGDEMPSPQPFDGFKLKMALPDVKGKQSLVQQIE